MSAELPSIGFGTFQHDDPDTCVESVRTALEIGYRHVDTAQSYGNEAEVGEALAAAAVDREDVLVATKLKPANLGYRDAIDSAERSRERLGVDTIDLLYVHWPIDAYDPGETLPALDELVDRGVVRQVGLSNFTPELLREAIEGLDASVFAHQVECHPCFPQPELRDLAEEYGHHLVAYSPLARGTLLDDPTVTSIADELDATPAQVCLAWAVQKGTVPIPKATHSGHIAENYDALDLLLDRTAMDRLDGIDRRIRTADPEWAPWN